MKKQFISRDELLVVDDWKKQISWEIYATIACNLQCVYCYNEEIDFQKTEPEYEIEELVRFLRMYSKPRDRLSFIGGEPLIRRNWIKKIIDATADMGFEYEAYTNGVNLGLVDYDLINHFKYFLISIDGDEEQNDRYRGKGTYSRILRQLEKIRPYYRGKIVGRMTVAPENDLEKSVKSLISLPYFDTIYWQFQNKKDFSGYPVEKKWTELKNLLDFWMENLKAGRFFHIQTFTAMVVRLLNEDGHPEYHFENYHLPPFTLGCGAGHNYMEIYIDGSIYGCPEMAGSDINYMGNIRNGIFRGIRLEDFSATEKCRTCEEFDICHCRCLHCTPEAYCTLIKRTIDYLRKRIPMIKSLVEQQVVFPENFFINQQLEEIF